ncbi:hypothetical protein H0H10_02150 [Streptomyces sp. TRM S81-3]|uniref:Uncharacterized protein n=1 Tax=Streptomyces griseicoloratus TaxID=2752516 RepID=A0A926QNZ3_9ACTN|nr:hypothetical protein [Streptomyces griseicoloratus]MBD0417985.1 hypothetical protein [Streptomyces griseicoloratus]
MATALRTAITAYRTRRGTRSLTQVRFCDAVCRAQAGRRSTELLALSAR